jgi:hypothetical protein
VGHEHERHAKPLSSIKKKVLHTPAVNTKLTCNSIGLVYPEVFALKLKFKADASGGKKKLNSQVIFLK